RLNKVRLYAVCTDKSMTQVIEELIDSLPTPEIGNSSSTNIAHCPEFIPRSPEYRVRRGASSALAK
ncbi:hypothetical protein LC612_41880, partial [Nostoc sp. CHAB 5834]|nr:hypothetical protein [Nostoc sp. CHAB 5834]